MMIENRAFYTKAFFLLATFLVFNPLFSRDEEEQETKVVRSKNSRPAPDITKFKQRISLNQQKALKQEVEGDSNDAPDSSDADGAVESKKRSGEDRQATSKATRKDAAEPELGEDAENKKDKKDRKEKKGKASEDDQEKKINPNLNNVSLSSFIKYMAELKKINLIPSSDANDSKVTLTLRESLSIKRAWEVFLTVMDSCGFCMVKIGDVHKVIKKDSIDQEPIRVVIGASEKNLEDSSEIIRAVVFLKNIPVGQAEGLVKTFLDAKAKTFAQQSLNALVLTDRSINIKSALTILNELDNSGLKETCYVIRLTNATASEVTKFLGDIIKRPEISSLARLLGQQSEGGADFFPGTVKLIADDRTNSVIMLGIESALNKLVDFIQMYFEGNWQTRTPFETHICQYSDCEQMKSILDEIINSDASKNSRNSRGLGSVRMECDKYSNKLIIYAQDARDLNEVKSLIKDLDKPQPMIAIEALIVTVDEQDLRELGGRFRLKNANSPVKGVDFQGAGTGAFTPDNSGGALKSLMGNLLPLVDAAEGSSVLAFGSSTKNDVWALLKAFQTSKNNNIVNKSFVTVSNNFKAVLHSGSTRSVKSEASSGTDAIVSYKSYQASTDFVITPQVSPDGLINLDIDLTIEDFANTALSNNEGDANKQTKKVTTKVTLTDGGFLVLGGFVKTNYSSSSNKTPILGDIPLLGWLSRSKKNSMIKSYTFMFVAPTIVKPQSTPGCGLYTKIKLHNAKDAVDSTFELDSKDPIDKWFFQEKKIENGHKILDFSNAKYQPTTVDVKNDELYKGKKISMDSFYKNADQKEIVVNKVPVGDDVIKIISQKEPALQDKDQDEPLKSDFSKKQSKKEYDLFHGKDPAMASDEFKPRDAGSALDKSAYNLTKMLAEVAPEKKKNNKLLASNQAAVSTKKAVNKPSPSVKKTIEKTAVVESEKPKVFKAEYTTKPSGQAVDPVEKAQPKKQKPVQSQRFVDAPQEPRVVPSPILINNKVMDFSSNESGVEAESSDDSDSMDFDRRVLAKTRSSGTGEKSFVRFLEMDGSENSSKVANARSEGQDEDSLDDFDSRVRSKVLSRPRIVSL